MSEPSELELARAAASGDAAAWNAIVERFGDMILAASMGWCEAGCRIPRGDYDCILRTIRAERPEPAEEPQGCREGLALYRHACVELRSRLGRFDGTTSLEAFVLAALAEIREDYLANQRGRLTMPAVLEGASPLANDVYRLATRIESRAEVARLLGVAESDVAAAEAQVAAALAGAGLAWWGLEPAIAPPAAASPAPAWVQRGVVEVGDAPEPTRPGDTIWRKALSQPDWLVGLALGAITTALCLLVVIPREEYVKSVREPGDVVLGEANRPLEPALATRLASARAELGRGQVDAAVQDLSAVLAVRGDNQEARWLLATTYDKLGDQARAAKHYKLFLDVDARQRSAADDRVKRAQARLGRFSEMP